MAFTEERKIPRTVYEHGKDNFKWHGLEFEYQRSSYSATTASKRKLGLEALHITFSGGQAARLNVTNSLHKLYWNGINYNDFTFSQLSDTIDYVGEILEIDFSDFQIKGGFEYAVNLKVDNPADYYARHMSYKTAIIAPMRKGKKLYGSEIAMGRYAIKLYNPIRKIELAEKTRLSIPQDILRVEMKTTAYSIRAERGIPLNTVGDLQNPAIIEELGNSLVKATKEIKTIPEPPLSASMQDFSLYHYFHNATEQRLTKDYKEKKWTFNRWKKQYEALAVSDFDLSQKVARKWGKLLAA